MISIGLLGLFSWGFYAGYRRGMLLQLVYLLGSLFSYGVATLFYRNLADILKLIVPFPKAQATTKMDYFSAGQIIDLDRAFYAGISFVLIYFICHLLVRFVAVFAYGLRFVPILGRINSVLGGVIGFGSVLIATVMLVKLLTMIPNNNLQQMLDQNLLVRTISNRVPFFSNDLNSLWIDQIIN